MAERTTVVFDDPELARRLKVAAAERGVPLKRLIEEAVRAYLGPAPEAETKPFDWDSFDAWQREVEEREAADDSSYPEDLSDVKEYLYPLQEEHRPGWLRVAEAPSRYDAGK